MSKEYYWTITATGYIEADSLEEAEEIIQGDKLNYMIEDESFATIEVKESE
tara:strand:- start:839 stop:991 length:153 start_codon:yes stop_codon:yes gene_type:complete